MKVFADTSFFIGFYDKTDQQHHKAVNMMSSLTSQVPEVVTTDYIYDETATQLLKTHPQFGYLRTLQFTSDVIDSEKFTLRFISEVFFAEARSIFKRYNRDKRWSFTDCTSYVVMKDFGISRVLTFDQHFKEMGFSVVK